MKRTQPATEAAKMARHDRELAEVKRTLLPPVKQALSKDPPKNALLGHNTGSVAPVTLDKPD